MKVISLLQPWASLVVMGAKKFETRSWDTRYRGPLLIHASKGKDPAGMKVSYMEPFHSLIKGIQGFYALPFGAIIGQVVLDSTIPTGSIVKSLEGSDEWHFGDYGPGRFAWRLTDAQKFEAPIPATGTLGLWEFPDDKILMRDGR